MGVEVDAHRAHTYETSPDRARSPERHLHQRRTDGGDVAQDPVVAQQQHRRGRPQHQPQPAPVGLAGEDRPVEALVRRATSTPPTAAPPGCRSAPATVGWPSPTSRPGSLRSIAGAPRAQAGARAPRRPRTRRPARRARWCPTTQVAVAQARRPSPATAKSVTDQPGLIGHGRYVGKSSAAPRWSANASYETSASPAATAAGTSPWTGQRGGPVVLDARRGSGGTPRPGTWVTVVTRPPASRDAAGSGVPGEDDRRSRARSPAREGRGVQPEEPAVGDRQPEPARGERPQGVAVPEDQRPLGHAAEPVDHAVQPLGDLVGGLAARGSRGSRPSSRAPPRGSRRWCGPRSRRTPTPPGPRRPRRRRSPASSAVTRARCSGLVSTRSKCTSASRSRSVRAPPARPRAVSGRSVVEVCRPDRLHSVSPCRTSQTSARWPHSAARSSRESGSPLLGGHASASTTTRSPGAMVNVSDLAGLTCTP